MNETMHWIDWTLVAVPLAVVMWIGMKSQRYVRGVADFLTAGRVAGRYVLCVADGVAGMGLISLVAIFEQIYQSGFAYGFWGSIASPIFIVLGLTGYCTYRFRETRAMTMGQFLEIRYSRRLRHFAGVLQSVSGIINYALFPAVGARFLVYFCGLPLTLDVFGWPFPTFGVLMAGFLALAVFIATRGGQVTIMTTDCVQGLLCYPMYTAIVIYVMTRFSWFRDLAPALLDRPAGQSMINPFDTTGLRDFNLFYVIVGIASSLLNRLGWSGNQGYACAARNAHEQKMGAVLGSWRSGFSGMMYSLLAIVAFAYLNSDKYQDGPRGAVACRTELAVKVVDDVAAGAALAPVRQEVVGYLKSGETTPALQALLDKTAALKKQEETARAKTDAPASDASAATDAPPADDGQTRQRAREARMQTARDALHAADPAKAQTMGTIYGQMRVPMALRHILPIGLTGIFCAICVFLMLSTDTTYLHSWGSILVQDIILPLRRKPFAPKAQLTLLRLAIAFVAVFAFFFSYFFGQVDYIIMFFTITGAIWLGGSGPCIVGGLYWKRGTAAAAWVSLVVGSTLSVGAILAQKYWVGAIYPWLAAHGLVETVARWLQRASAPFEPLIEWRMSAEKFPINSQEVYAVTMLVSVGLYVIVSLLTSRGGRVFNMERMLHRGQYHREGIKMERPRLTWRTLYSYFVGIDNQYTRGDKILAWSVFVWSFVWGFLCCFVGVAIWNFVSPWGNAGWSRWFFINNFILATVIGVVSTVWFTLGGIRDLRRLFRDLARHEANVLDDGRVLGHVSADDVALVEGVEHAHETETGEESR